MSYSDSDPESQRQNLIPTSAPTMSSDSNNKRGFWSYLCGTPTPVHRNWRMPKMSPEAAMRGLRNYFAVEIIGSLNEHICNWWTFSPYNMMDYKGGSGKDWPIEVAVYMFKWLFMLLTSMASMIAIYILTSNGTFGQQLVYTTNFLGNGQGIHTTTTVGVVPIGWLLASAWAIPLLFSLLFLASPYITLRYVTGFVNYRYDVAFTWSWLGMFMLFSFVLTGLVGASDVFVCLLTSAVFTSAVYIFTVQVQHDTFNVYKFLGQIFHRTAGDDVFSIDVTTRPTLGGGRQEVGAGHLSQEYIAFLLAQGVLKQSEAENWFLHHEELVRHLEADKDTIFSSLERLIGDFHTILFPVFKKHLLTIFHLLLGFTILMAYWIQNEHTDATGFYWPVTTVFWTFFVFILMYYGWSTRHYSERNRAVDYQRSNEPVLLGWLPHYHFIVSNTACWIFFQFCTWIIMAGLDKNGILYYSP